MGVIYTMWTLSCQCSNVYDVLCIGDEQFCLVKARSANIPNLTVNYFFLIIWKLKKYEPGYIVHI
jgi:hypothetical protein